MTTEQQTSQQPEKSIASGVHTDTPIAKSIENEKDEIVSAVMALAPQLVDMHKKQPVVWRCFNPHCRPYPTRPTIPFDFESTEAKCPKCSLGPPMVAKRALIHMLVNVPDGPIVGDLGLRYRIVCEKNRDYVTTGRDGESASGDPTQVNCPGCIAEVTRRFQAFGATLKMGDKA